MKKYILIPYANLTIGGVPTKIIDIVNTLGEMHPDIAVRVLLQHGKPSDQRSLIHNPNASVIDFSFPIPLGRRLAYILWLWWFIFRLRPVAVLAFLSPYALPALLAKLLIFWLPFRVIVSEDHYTQTMLRRMAVPWLQQIAIRFLYPHADAIVIPTRAIKHQLGLLCRLNTHKTHIIHNWTSLTKAPTSKNKRIWDIIHIGRLVQSKHPLQIVKIMARYIHKYPNTKCAIVGEGEEVPRIRRYLHAHRLEKRILIYPATIDVSHYLFQAKIFLFLPEGQTEGFPMVLLEAMACGTIVVTKRFRGGEEMLANNQNAIIAPRAKIIPILIHHATINKRDIQSHARSYVKKYCSPQNIHQYIDVLESEST